MITADGKVVTLIPRDCCPYLDDHEPNYVNPAVAAPQEVGHSVTWDPDFVSDEISASAGSRSSKRKIANSASAGSKCCKGVGDPSAPAGGPIGDRWSDLDAEDEHYGMPVSQFSEAGEYSSEGESDDETGTTCLGERSSPSLPGAWRTLTPLMVPFRVLYVRRQLESPFLVSGW